MPFISWIDRDIVFYADDQDIEEVKIHTNTKRGRVEPEATGRQTRSISFCNYFNIIFSGLPLSHIIMNSLSLF